MADIDVVPKHRSNLWLWIVVAIIVCAFLIWAFAGRSRTAATTELQPVQPAVVSHAIVASASGTAAA